MYARDEKRGGGSLTLIARVGRGRLLERLGELLDGAAVQDDVLREQPARRALVLRRPRALAALAAAERRRALRGVARI